MCHFARTRVAFILGVVFCAPQLGFDQTPNPADAIGIVDWVKGRWIRPQDNKDLIRGDILFRGQTVSIEFSQSASISIVLFASGTVWRKFCTKQTSCEGSYRPPSPSTSETGFWTFLRGYWRSEVKVPSIFAGARSVSAGGPSHAVLLMREGKIDLQPALLDVPSGRYSILLKSQSCSGQAAASTTQSATIDWGPGMMVQLTAPSPGLYSLELFDTGRVGAVAAVLIVSWDRRDIVGVWQDVLKRSRQWADIDAGTLDDLYTAMLCGLDTESQP